MKWAIRVYLRGMKSALLSSLAYRADFFLNTIISLATNMIMPMITLLIYGSDTQFPGWSIYEALLIQGIFTVSLGFTYMFFVGIAGETINRIRQGEFDLIMIRPGPAAFISLANAFDPSGAGVLLGGIGLMVVSLLHLPAPTAVNWLAFALLFIMGLAVTLGCALIIAAISFKWVGNSRMFEIYTVVTDFGRYPATIFSRVLTAIVSFVLPVAMIGFFPASALLGRLSVEMFIAIIPCIAFLAFGFWLFQAMVRNYQSAGG